MIYSILKKIILLKYSLTLIRVGFLGAPFAVGRGGGGVKLLPV